MSDARDALASAGPGGYGQYKHFFLEALTAHKMPGLDLQLVLAIVRETYGRRPGNNPDAPPKTKADLSVNLLAERTGASKSSVSDALRRLIANRVIIEFKGSVGTQSRTIGPNKYVDEWCYPRRGKIPTETPVRGSGPPNPSDPQGSAHRTLGFGPPDSRVRPTGLKGSAHRTLAPPQSLTGKGESGSLNNPYKEPLEITRGQIREDPPDSLQLVEQLIIQNLGFEVEEEIVAREMPRLAKIVERAKTKKWTKARLIEATKRAGQLAREGKRPHRYWLPNTREQLLAILDEPDPEPAYPILNVATARTA
ncbi:MAG: replication protein [Vulcanimicrobiota bacterium]